MKIPIVAILLAVMVASVPVAFATHTDRVVSEGVDVIGSAVANDAGYTGKGIKIAIIDGGFDLENTEIKSHVKGGKSFIAGETCTRDITRCGNTGHGTAVTEIVADIAPDAELYLYNFGPLPEFFNLVNYLIDRRDIDIISMSLGYEHDGVGPINGKGRMAQKVDEARASGILWINAAGNEAQKHWSGQFHDSDNDNWHNFDGINETNPINAIADDEINITLSWDKPNDDYDLCLRAGTQEFCTNEKQPGSDPSETLSVDVLQSGRFGIAIKKNFLGTNDATFHLYSTHELEKKYQVASSSLSIPADAKGAMAVGATLWSNDELIQSSSRGPTLDRDSRAKPDISAPSVVSTLSNGGVLTGTSAATPHIAGAAALVMQKYPNATANQVQKILESTVASRQSKSNDYGTGRVDVRMLANADIDILALENSNRSCASNSTCFYPETLRISRGDMVTWVNTEKFPITITGSTGSNSFTSGQIPYKGNYTQTFTTDGTFSYSDGLHPWATGQIIVGTGLVGQIPYIESAKFTGSNTVTITFTKNVTLPNAASHFTNLRIAGESTDRTVMAASLRGSGNVAIVTFGGEAVPTSATGTINVADVADTQKNVMNPAPNVPVTDGQAPILDSVLVTGPNTITATWTEKVYSTTTAGVRDGTDPKPKASSFESIRLSSVSTTNTINIRVENPDAACNTPGNMCKYDLTITNSSPAISLSASASGIMTIKTLVDAAGNQIARIPNVTIGDGQAPIVLDANLSITGPNQFTITSTEPLRADTATFTDMMADHDGDGKPVCPPRRESCAPPIGTTPLQDRNVTGVTRGDANSLVITFDGEPVSPAATGNVKIQKTLTDFNDNIAKIGATQSSATAITNTTAQTPRVLNDGQNPKLYRAELGDGKYIQVVFSESTRAPLNSYSNLNFAGELRELRNSPHSGDRHHLNYMGAKATATTATMSVGTGLADPAGNKVTTTGTIPVHADERPEVVSASITDNNEITITFSEPVRNVEQQFTVTLEGEVGTKSPHSVSGEYTNMIRLMFADNTFAAGATGMLTIREGITDLLEKPLGNVSTALISPPQGGASTTISGTVCISIINDGTCDAGDPGYASNPPYSIYLVPPANSGLMFDGNPYRTAQVNQDTGMYRFDDVIPNIEWVVQTLYFPRDLTVKDDATSWYTRVTPAEGQEVTFDVAFYRVPQSERNTLELRTYNDINRNGVRDIGEDGISGLTFRAYTYLSASYEYVVTGANGSATKSDMMRGDWALLSPEGWQIITIDYHRTDSTSGKQYRANYPVVDNPEPGSVHTMTFGLSRAS